MKRKRAVNDDLCAQGLTDSTERKIMAKAMEGGEEQIKIFRHAKELTDSDQEPENSDQEENESS